MFFILRVGEIGIGCEKTEALCFQVKGIFSCHVSSLEQFSSTRSGKQRALYWIQGVFFFFLFDDINVLFRKSLGDLGLETYEGLRTGFTSQRTFDDVVKLLSKDVGAELLIVHVKNCTSRLRSWRVLLDPYLDAVWCIALIHVLRDIWKLETGT